MIGIKDSTLTIIIIYPRTTLNAHKITVIMRKIAEHVGKNATMVSSICFSKRTYLTERVDDGCHGIFITVLNEHKMNQPWIASFTDEGFFNITICGLHQKLESCRKATEKSSKMRKLSREMNEKCEKKRMCQNQRPKTGCTECDTGNIRSC